MKRGDKGLSAVRRPQGAVSTQGNAPPCEVAKQMDSLSMSRDRDKAKESTFHVFSKCLGDAGLKTSWDSERGRETVLNRQLYASRGGKNTQTPPPHTICASGCYLTCKTQTLAFRKHPICIFLCDSCIVIASLMHYAGA